MHANFGKLTQFQGPPGQEDMPYLLTPGPLTTSRTVKLAALADWGSRDTEFRNLVQDIRNELKALAGGDESYECVMLQGSGTFAIEAALGSFCPAKRKKTLVVANGAYGDRAASILERLSRPFVKIDKGDTRSPTAAEVAAAIDNDRAISHVWVVHCETTSGIVNPVREIGHEVQSRGRVLMVDAMSSFGALPLDLRGDGIDVMVSSSNKCIEGLPGFSYVIARRSLLETSAGQSHSIVLDLFEQWQGLQGNGQFRFTPPTQVIVAFRQALRELAAEGGPPARLARYQRNAAALLEPLTKMGLVPLLAEHERGPIIQTILQPRDPNFSFEKFYGALRQRGYVIYPGKLTKKPSFRIGTMGQLDERVMQGVAAAIKDVLQEMGVSDLSPKW